ncbi:response regulator [Pseudoalteromonas luteoviolacea]|uniref:response regulator n=1 Tax=Pseudoalteromonas luteoviolacea TaxID=43657 RepID=UPI001EEDFE6C|nr:response regulator [Pseudoalteromonas luteoviolacea]MCF6442784.1 response regulator [Pseudoalteromonas luteoviolacea]
MKIKPTNVLLLDDDKLILRALSRALKKQLGADNVVALNDPTLLEQYLANASGSFDLFITDFQMPIVNGEQALKIVQQMSPLTTRVLMSGDIESLRSRPQKIAANLMIAKPFSVDDLCMLDDIYNRSQSTNLCQEQRLKLGFMPYVPLPDIKLINYQKNKKITELDNQTQLIKHLDSIVKLEIKDKTLIPQIQHASFEMVQILSQLVEQLIYTISTCTLNKTVEKYYLLATKAFAFAKRNNLQISDCERLLQFVLSLTFNELIRIYLDELYRNRFDISLYDHFGAIWGIDTQILAEKKMFISDNADSEVGLIFRAIVLNLNTEKEDLVSDIINATESTIDSLRIYSQQSSVNSYIEEEFL